MHDMQDDDVRRRVFWLLKRLSSYGLWKRKRDAWEVFARSYEGAVKRWPKSQPEQMDADKLPRIFETLSLYNWTCPCMSGHAVTLRLMNLLVGETRVVSSISGRCADATRCSGQTRWPGSATPFSRPAWASTRRSLSSSF